MAAAFTVARTFIRPPTLELLPPRQPRSRSMLTSILLHGIAMAALIWLPPLFPSPVFMRVSITKRAAPEDVEPLLMPQLPQLADRGSGSSKPAKSISAVGSGPVSPPADPPPQKPDYIGPQEIVSEVPNAVNHIQTIRRPDLVKPPSIRFPLRLQSIVSLPASSRPALTAPPRPNAVPDVAVAEEVPIAELALPNPALTLVPRQVAVAPSDATPLQTMAIVPVPAEPAAKTVRAVIVVNAVNVPPDPAVAAPDAELAGRFVVGPAPGASTTEKSSPAGAGRSTGSTVNSGESSPSVTDSGNGADPGSSHASGPGGANRANTGTGPGSGTVVGKGTAGGNESAPGTAGKAGAGGGTGSGSAPGPGSGIGAPGRSAGNGHSGGISISGGVPGRGSASIASAVTPRHSYGMMIIAGGNSGGASRDVGFFDRNETVYSVTIPMADAGGGPDWTMQYALANPAQASTGLLSPPFVQKKAAATMPASELAGAAGPVFIGGIIDENGKLQSLKAIRVQDVRSQPAIRALQQWEFLPEQLDGKPVAGKVLIGVSVTAVREQK